MTERDVLTAVKNLIEELGSQEAVAQRSGVQRSQISDYVRDNPTRDIGNMTLKTFFRLFPNAEINFTGAPTGTAAASDLAARTAEEDLLKIFRALPPDQQIHCLTLVAATFPNEAKKG